MTSQHEPDLSRSLQPSGSGSRISRLGASARLPTAEATADVAAGEDAGRIGRMVSGRYRIDSLISSGAQAAVFCGMDLIRQERCAIKLLRPGASQQQRSLLEREAARRLFHPNIVSVYEYGEDDLGTPFLVMELLSGRSLQALLQESGPLPFGQALEILRNVGAALEYMHSQGLMYLNLHPEHVFLSPRVGGPAAGRDEVKLIGFGQVRFLNGEEPPSPRASSGLLALTAYQAPELTLARDGSGAGATCDARADQWSLAVLAYRLFAGREPFVHADPHKLGWAIRQEEPTPLHQLCPGLPAHVCHAVQMALTKRREHRFDRVHDLIRALEHRSSLVEPKRAPPTAERPAADSRLALQTVQCLRADLIELSRIAEAAAAAPPAPAAVPEPIEAEIPTERYSNRVLSEALRMSSEVSPEGEGSGAGGAAAAGAGPSPRPPLPARTEQPIIVLPAADRSSHRPLRWLLAAFSVALALGALLILARSLGRHAMTTAPSVEPTRESVVPTPAALLSVSRPATATTPDPVAPAPSEPVLRAVASVAPAAPPAVAVDSDDDPAADAHDCAAAVPAAPKPTPSLPSRKLGSKPGDRRGTLAALPAARTTGQAQPRVAPNPPPAEPAADWKIAPVY